MDHQRELECIREVLSGRTQRFSALVEAYQSGAFNLCWKMLGSRDEARDCTQEAFIKAYESLSTFRQDARFSTWFYRIVYNTCISRIRKAGQEKKVDIDLAGGRGLEVDNDGIGSLNREDMRMLLENAYKVLDSDELFLIDRFYHGEASVEELAQMTRLSASNVKVKLYRARLKMKQAINVFLKEETEIWQTR
jgi:RNA polymerase sigma-70 factor (ECF subfamily)